MSTHDTLLGVFWPHAVPHRMTATRMQCASTWPTRSNESVAGPTSTGLWKRSLPAEWMSLLRQPHPDLQQVGTSATPRTEILIAMAMKFQGLRSLGNGATACSGIRILSPGACAMDQSLPLQVLTQAVQHIW